MDRTTRPLVIVAAFASSLLVVLVVLLWMLGGLRSVTAPAAIGGAFQLTDQTGQTVTEKNLQGKPTLIFFGFTHCPDACPPTMAELAKVDRELGPDADRMQVLFVTVDPERDTQSVLAQYVPAFDSRFVGLYGSAEETARAAKEFKIYYQKQPLPGGGYTMDHSAGTFVLDKQGRLRLFAQYGAGAQALLHDIRLLIAE